MENVRLYGEPPYKVVLVHGGPGAAGEMAPVAQRLSSDFGIVEPLQSKDSVEGQIEELKEQISSFGCPLVFIGHSWGAWLTWMFAARYPKIASHIILVGTPAFDESYTNGMAQKRLDRLDDDDRYTAKHLLDNAAKQNLDSEEFALLGRLIAKADTYCQLEEAKQINILPANQNLYCSVWPQAQALRKNGQLLKLSDRIKCKITFIHGKYDTHPYEGVQDVLNEYGVDFEFILLDKCGHTPWKEKHCVESFYNIIKVLIRENI